MRWSENETCLFVRLYLSQRNLWDVGHENYKSKIHREISYKEIISKFHDLTNMELDVNFLRMKIRTIRSTYSQELAKIRNRSTTERPFTPSLKWFPIMHSTLMNRRYRKPKEEFLSGDDQNDTGEEGDEDLSQKIWVSGESGAIEDNEETEKDPFISPNEDDYILLLKSEPQDIERKEVKYRQKKRKIKHRSTSSDMSEPGNRSVNYEAPKEDEFDIYGKYIAAQLRGMGIQRALQVQLQIQKFISDARIEQISNGD